MDLETKTSPAAPSHNRSDNESVEVQATSAVLTAAALWIGDECGQVNDLFMACKRASNDPTVCAEAGLAVSSCINNL
jgi:hypothetical protein